MPKIPALASSKEYKDYKKAYQKSQRDYLKSLSPEKQEEIRLNRIYDKQKREEDKQVKRDIKEYKLMLKKTLDILLFMKRTDVKFYHHKQAESQMDKICKAIEHLKQKDCTTSGNTKCFRINGEYKCLPAYDQYDPYIWNYQGQGKNRLPICQFGCIWKGPFDSIYDVPLDGSYVFSIYDSGQRGLGSFNGITATRVNEVVEVPEVSPGSIIPKTAF